ncbi:hypothetical protein EV140_0866 [Microcella alkaliphila]|uniref:Uncharacterized protein n=1 Tax=Microcella alkaliphila TaxID=279828 RepID=A0A4Q7TND3_9MICO|nr:hypothetical protein [Microcella alkaliphila]RZT62344.1 hypothetical protein EV140_0866 [Microcella alkaliphila]
MTTENESASGASPDAVAILNDGVALLNGPLGKAMVRASSTISLAIEVESGHPHTALIRLTEADGSSVGFTYWQHVVREDRHERDIRIAHEFRAWYATSEAGWGTEILLGD